MGDIQTIFWLSIINIVLCVVFFMLSLVIFFFKPTRSLQANPPKNQTKDQRFHKILNKDGRTYTLRDKYKPVYNDDSKLYQDEIRDNAGSRHGFEEP